MCIFGTIKIMDKIYEPMKKLITLLFFVSTAVLHTTAQTDVATQLPDVETDTIARLPDVKAEYPGGIPELMKFLSSELSYPKEASENNIQGMVLLEFVVCSDGTVCNVKVIKGVHESLDNEAIRVVETMDKWTPGKSDGENTASYFQLPVQYKLETKAETKQRRKQEKQERKQKKIKTFNNKN